MIDNTFLIGDLLGVGGSAKVYSVDADDGNQYAMKIMRKDKDYTTEQAQKLVKHEYHTMTQLPSHPNIISWVGYNDKGDAYLNDGVHQTQYLVFEKCQNGTLSKIIRQTGPLEEDICKLIFLQMCSAVKSMHDVNYAHLDIKLENILLDEFFNVKISDMGLAKNVKDTQGTVNKRCGTYQYMAPEVKDRSFESAFDAFSLDIYSLGVWLHLLLTGEFPWEYTFEDESMCTQVTDESYNSESETRVKQRMQYLSQGARDLLQDLLEEETVLRWKMDEVLQHSWFYGVDCDGLKEKAYDELNHRVQYINTSKSSN